MSRAFGRNSPPALLWINQFALLPEDGGGTRHFELGRELCGRGWRVTVMAADLHLHRRTYTRRADASDRSVIRETRDGVELQWLWAAGYQHNNWRRAWNWLSFSQAVQAAGSRIERPSIVVGSSPQLFAANAARAVARRHGVPFVFEVRDLWPESLLAVGGRRGLTYAYLERLAAGLYRDADRVIVLARGTMDYLADRGVARSKLVHIPNGVDLHLVSPARVSAATSRAPDQPLVLIYAGAHGPANGLDRVLDAAEILGPSMPVRFLLIGDGPAKADLRADVLRRGLVNVELRDAVSKQELNSLFQQCAAGLMILRDAPLFSFAVSPNKLFDYLAAGLPVIGNVPGEVAQMLADSGAGVQARDTSGAALAAAIREFMATTDDERRRRGISGRQWVEREHGREVLGERLDQCLREMI